MELTRRLVQLLLRVAVAGQREELRQPAKQVVPVAAVWVVRLAEQELPTRAIQVAAGTAMRPRTAVVVVVVVRVRLAEMVLILRKMVATVATVSPLP